MHYREETLQRLLYIVNSYIEKDNVQDLIKYATANGEMSMRNILQWVDFVKEYCSEEVYEKFMEKAMPFLNPDGSENEELKKKVCRMSYNIFQKKAGLIDIVKEITPNVNKFVYMAKQLRFFYKELPPYVYNEVVKIQTRTMGYNSPKTVFNASIESLSDKENQMIIDFIRENDLLVNNATYYEAYYYLVKKGVLGKKNTTR